jgi:hypothetical protein
MRFLFLAMLAACSAFGATTTIDIVFPQGGEYFFTGQTQSIRLSPKTRFKKVRIELSRDNGVTFESLGVIDNTVARSDRNVLVIQIAGAASTHCVLRAVSDAPQAMGRTGAFSIQTGTDPAPQSVKNGALASGAVTTDKISSGSAADGFVLTANGSGDADWKVLPTGTVTSVSATPPLSVTNPTTTPHISLAIGSTAGTVAAGDDPRLSDARVASNSSLTAAASKIPLSDTSGKIADGWLSSNVVLTNDARLSDARVASNSSLTAAASKIPLSDNGGKIADGWLSSNVVLGNDARLQSWNLAGNANTDSSTQFLGTTDNQALEIRTNGIRASRISPAVSSDDAPTIVNGFSGNQASLVPGVSVIGATIGGGGATAEVNAVQGLYGTVSGGKGNLAVGYAVVAGGRSNRSNGLYGNVGGGLNNLNNENYSIIGGGQDNYIGQIGQPNAFGGSSATTIGGGYSNTISCPASGNSDLSTISGGGFNKSTGVATTISGGSANEVKADYSTIGGGQLNTAKGTHGIIGGGYCNTTLGMKSTVSGGYINQATSDYSAVCGGQSNSASGNSSFVGGGYANNASGQYAMIPGGYFGKAMGDYSFAAGNSPQAQFSGEFVWSDSLSSTFPASSETLFTPQSNDFLVRATGGVVFVTGVTSGVASSGVQVAAGSGTWASLSDRNAKENLADVDCGAVLKKIADLPVMTWNYKTQDRDIRHMGPMAQDFMASFQVGESDRRITTVDADGVALAGIKGLYEVVQQQQRQIETLEIACKRLQDNLDSRLLKASKGDGESE